MPAIRQAPGPYEPCYCHSGKKYRFCHYPIDQAPAREQRQLSQTMYVERWSGSADNLEQQGCYAWMASILAAYGPRFILDVGCGDGRGLLAIRQACVPATIWRAPVLLSFHFCA
jgi:hypothetical protein